MTAYARGELSIEAYLVRIIAAICRQNGGETRVKGELIDTVGEATALLKSWDSKTQELVLTVNMGTFGEVFKVVPEKQNQNSFVFPKAESPSQEDSQNPAKRAGSTLLDDQKFIDLEKKLTKRRVAAMLADELKNRNRGAQQ